MWRRTRRTEERQPLGSQFRELRSEKPLRGCVGEHAGAEQSADGELVVDAESLGDTCDIDKRHDLRAWH